MIVGLVHTTGDRAANFECCTHVEYLYCATCAAQRETRSTSQRERLSSQEGTRVFASKEVLAAARAGNKQRERAMTQGSSREFVKYAGVSLTLFLILGMR